jgi:hypothetical protein
LVDGFYDPMMNIKEMKVRWREGILCPVHQIRPNDPCMVQ